ncbi:hypothetical protein GGR57DRAFT_498377 [Xylariaceae sp. FL1272]|nr:hypothetical protein GGR57DRAFT_498377 [Xylariaceae sp. FL1272]
MYLWRDTPSSASRNFPLTAVPPFGLRRKSRNVFDLPGNKALYSDGLQPRCDFGQDALAAVFLGGPENNCLLLASESDELSGVFIAPRTIEAKLLLYSSRLLRASVALKGASLSGVLEYDPWTGNNLLRSMVAYTIVRRSRAKLTAGLQHDPLQDEARLQHEVGFLLTLAPDHRPRSHGSSRCTVPDVPAVPVVSAVSIVAAPAAVFAGAPFALVLLLIAATKRLP